MRDLINYDKSSQDFGGGARRAGSRRGDCPSVQSAPRAASTGAANPVRQHGESGVLDADEDKHACSIGAPSHKFIEIKSDVGLYKRHPFTPALALT